jgi:serine/threonine protein kinase
VALRQVIQEAALLRLCASPSVVALLDVHASTTAGAGPSYLLVMECVEHSLSRELLLNPRGLSSPRVARLGLQLATALAHIHEQGVIWRDLKPANILLDGQDAVKICDLGSALIHQSNAGAGTEHASLSLLINCGANGAQPPTNAAAAAMWYRAPESTLGSSPTPGSDVWAFGKNQRAPVPHESFRT